MISFIMRRLTGLITILALANLAGFGYAYFILYRMNIQFLRGDYAQRFGESPSFTGLYGDYLQGVLRGNWGALDNGQPVTEAIARLGVNSLGLVGLALLLSIVFGILLGWGAVRNDPPRTSGWLTVLSTVGLASPGFYIGIWLIAFSVFYLLSGMGTQPLLPFQGFGWDEHLVLPVLALMLRPMVQIAQLTAGLLAGELSKPYTVAARSFGYNQAAILRHVAFRNVAASVVLVISGSLRLLVAELIILERLFNWPGLGRLLAANLTISEVPNPPVMAALIMALAAFFFIGDLFAALIARALDPRLQTAPEAA